MSIQDPHPAEPGPPPFLDGAGGELVRRAPYCTVALVADLTYQQVARAFGSEPATAAQAIRDELRSLTDDGGVPVPPTRVS